MAKVVSSILKYCSSKLVIMDSSHGSTTLYIMSKLKCEPNLSPSKHTLMYTNCELFFNLVQNQTTRKRRRNIILSYKLSCVFQFNHQTSININFTPKFLKFKLIWPMPSHSIYHWMDCADMTSKFIWNFILPCKLYLKNQFTHQIYKKINLNI